MEIRNDLQFDLCIGCGEIAPKGIISHIQHDCPLNNVVIYFSSANFSFRHFSNLFNNIDELKSFRELLDFPHFKAMPDFDRATMIEKIIYSICREDEIKAMKRIREYIQLEEKFQAKW